MCFVLSSCSFFKNSGEDDDTIIMQPENSSVFNLAIDSIDTFNPILTKSVSIKDAMQLIFEPLYSFDEGLNPIPVLAKSCTKSDNAMNYQLKIKDSVFWHDNTALTALDVLHTINLIRFNDTSYTKRLSCIGSVSLIDNYTLSINLKRPVPNFYALLSFPIIQNSSADQLQSDYLPIGTGPFKYDSKISSDNILLVINENWHNTLPAINEVHLNTLKNTSDIINAFNAGYIDAVTSTVINLSNNAIRGEISGKDYTSNALTFLGFNTSKSFFKSPNTRKALSYLIDRADIVTNEIFSRGVASKIPVNPSAWYYPKIADTKHDNQYIHEMLTLDGWAKTQDNLYKRTAQRYDQEQDKMTDVEENLKANILVNDNNEERYRIATNIAEKFNAFGIQTTITLVSYEDYVQRTQNLDYSVFIGEIKLSENMDAYSLLSSSGNYFSYSSNAMDSMIYQLGITTPENQAKIYTDYANLFLEEMPFVPLFFRKESVYFEKSVQGISAPNLFCSYQNPQNWYITNKRPIETNTQK